MIPVRSTRRLGEGDDLAYRIEAEHVLRTEGERVPIDDPLAIFGEWSSEVDRRAFGDL
jgi:hypothetical protein